METMNEKPIIISEIVTRITEPARYKIKLYHLAVLFYIDHIMTLLINKYMFFRVKIEEKKTNLKIVNLEQSQLKLDLLSKENLQRSVLVVQKFKYKLKREIVNIQSMHENCVSHEETPALFCEPYIHTGFRPINKPYSFYLKSLFTKHNESVNAWSHYLGALVTISLVFRLDFSDPYSWPILTCIITSTFMFISSATAHLMHQKSHYCHMTCFLCDFGGISFNSFGAAFMQTYICSPIWYYKLLEPYLLPLIGFQSALCCLLNCIAQTNYKRPYPPMKRFLQFAPCGFLWLFTILPLFLSLIVNESDQSVSFQIDYKHHFLHMIVFLIGAALFALDFPQRLFPGKMDFFGQGHHLFHMCIFAVVTLQIRTCYNDYLANRDLIAASRTPPTFSFCFASLITLIIYYIYIIYSFNRMIKHNFDKEGNLIEKKAIKEN